LTFSIPLITLSIPQRNKGKYKLNGGNIMKHKDNKLLSMKLSFILLVLISTVLTSPVSSQSLKEIYAAGSVQFVEEMRIDESTLPEGEFFESIADMGVDEAGNVYLCDYKACNIKKFSSQGKFLKVIGKKGQGPAEFNSPSHMAVSGKRLFIFDIGNRRLCSLTIEGQQIKYINISTTEGLPREMRALPNGDILLQREVNYYHQKDKPQDILIQVFSPEFDLKKTLIKHPILKNIFRNISGMFSNIIQPFSPYVYMSTTPDSKVIIGLSEDYSIQIHHPEKGLLSSFSHSYKPVKVTHQDKKKFFSNLTYTTPQGRIEAPEEIKKLTKFPKNKPAFDSLLVDYEGNILVHPIQKTSEESPPQFDAFTSEGQFIGTVRIQQGIQHFPRKALVDRNSIWIIKRDQDGMTNVIKYKIVPGIQ
jgi:hypothetical protein